MKIIKEIQRISASVTDVKIVMPGILSSFTIILCIGFLFIGSCVAPFEPEIDKYDNVLVVEGLITNLPGSCKVKLSHTYPYNGRKFKTESGARVIITDNRGNETIFPETEVGEYVPASQNYAGIIGRQYKISIETAAGELFHSEFEEMKDPVEIGDIYFNYVEKENGYNGIQLYVDTFDPLNKSFYYSWDYKETWEFWVPYVSRSVFLTEMKICYKNASSRKFLIESTKDYINDKVVGFPIIFIDNSTNRLSVKYSLLVTQYVLTENTYMFYKNLKNINENVGTLFDRTPIILVGNIRNTLHPEQPVLGNFQVSGASEKRIFIYKENLPSQLIIPTEYEHCETKVLSVINDSFLLDSLLNESWAVMDTLTEPAEQDTFFGLANSRSCFDCTTAGDIEMPNFWDGH